MPSFCGGVCAEKSRGACGAYVGWVEMYIRCFVQLLGGSKYFNKCWARMVFVHVLGMCGHAHPSTFHRGPWGEAVVCVIHFETPLGQEVRFHFFLPRSIAAFSAQVLTLAISRCLAAH